MKTFTVYCHTCKINNKKYVGITSQKLNKRWNYGNSYLNTRFGNAIKKYGWENFEHEILFENLTKEEAEQKEIELIRELNLTNREIGYNTCLGGEGTNGYSFTDEDRKKMSMAHKNIKLSDSHKENIKLALKEYYKTHKYKVNEEAIKRMTETRKKQGSPWNKGRKISEEAKEKIRLANIGKKQSDETKIKRAKKLSKPVEMLTKDEEYIRTFSSISEASIYVKCNTGHITECCRGIRKTIKGYKWRYAK